MPTFVPRIVMIATYTQYTQMPIILSTSSSIQTDRQTLNNTSTQTKTFQTTRATQTSSPQNSKAVQTDHMVNDTLPLDSTDSSTSTDVLDEAVVLINQSNSNRKRKTHKDHSSDNRSSSKERKKVSFLQDQQNSPKLLDNNISMTEITPILETYGHTTWKLSRHLKLLELWWQTVTAINLSDTNQPLAQTVSYHNELQPMSSQQRAAMAQAALINFFGESGTISSIMHTVQPSQTQTSNWTIKSTWDKCFKQSARYVFANFYTWDFIHHTTHNTFKKNIHKH